MHSLSSLLLSALLLTADVVTSSPTKLRTRQSSTAPLRVLPLGASITFGTNSGTGNGYRKNVRDLFRSSGHDVNMIGSVHGGDMCDNSVEGWPGFVIDQITDKAKLSAPQKPNLILINAGTNDCGQNIDLANINTRMGKLLDYLYATAPDTTIILSTLLYNGYADVNPRVVNANADFTKLVNQRAAQGNKIVLADMYNDGSNPNAKGPLPSEITDRTHPNDAGYQKMANIWFDAFKTAVAKNWISAPATDVNVPLNGDSEDCTSRRMLGMLF